MWEPSDDEPMSGSDEDEHKVWSRVLGLCFHCYVRQRFPNCLSDIELGRLALMCHFALDILCDDNWTHACSRSSRLEPSPQVGLGRLVSMEARRWRGKHIEGVWRLGSPLGC